MTTPQLRQDLIILIGQVTGATGAFVGRGGAGVRNGAGDYTLTYDGGQTIDTTECSVLTQIVGATLGLARSPSRTDTTCNVLTFSTAFAAADLDFHILVVRFAP